MSTTPEAIDIGVIVGAANTGASIEAEPLIAAAIEPMGTATIIQPEGL